MTHFAQAKQSKTRGKVVGGESVMVSENYTPDCQLRNTDSTNFNVKANGPHPI